MRPAARRKRIAKPPEERLEDLLSAAAEIFAERGLARAKVEDITERAGVSKGTFYLYFASKEQISEVLWERYINGFMEIGEHILADGSKSHLERIVGTFRALSDYVLKNAELHRTVFQGTHTEERRAVTQRFISAISAAVQAGIAAGEIRVREPEIAVRVLYHGIGTSMHDAIASGEELRADAMIDAIGEMARLVFSGDGAQRPAGAPGRGRARGPALRLSE